MIDQTHVYVVDSNQVEDYTEYSIEVHHGGFIWTVKHRYSEFKGLHDLLRSKHSDLEKNLLPPKKIFGKMSQTFVDKRRMELEVYLQALLCKKYTHGFPRPLRKFLHFQFYDVEMLCQVLAFNLYQNGDIILASGGSYTLTPLQLWAVTERFRLQKPQSDSENPKFDFGHVLDFLQKLKHLHIQCQRGPVKTSNIISEELIFDISVCHSLRQLVADGCGPNQVQCFANLRKTITSLSVHQSLTDLQTLLAGGFDAENPSINWSNLITTDFSDNDITAIDSSVKLMTCVEFLDLSKNKITRIENLEHLSSLTFLDLSFNFIEEIEFVHAKLGNVKTFNLSNNKLASLKGLAKLYSLESLDVSRNLISETNEVEFIAKLPCISKLNLTNNAMTFDDDYRTCTLSRFGSRACEITLDDVESSQKELDTAAVLHAILKSRKASQVVLSKHDNFTRISSPIKIKRNKRDDDSASMSAPGRLHTMPTRMHSPASPSGNVVKSFTKQNCKPGSVPDDHMMAATSIMKYESSEDLRNDSNHEGSSYKSSASLVNPASATCNDKEFVGNEACQDNFHSDIFLMSQPLISGVGETQKEITNERKSLVETFDDESSIYDSSNLESCVKDDDSLVYNEDLSSDDESSHHASHDIDESQHASCDIDESHHASHDIDESQHASNDIDESQHASCDIDESHHASHDIDESSHHASNDIDESQHASRDIDESQHASRDIDESHNASRDIGESSHHASHDIDESQHASRDIDESHNASHDIHESSHHASHDIDESQHASRDIDESHNASRDIHESSHHASRDIDESHNASSDIDESHNASRDIDESHHASHEIDESHNALRDIHESSHHASRDIDESHNASSDIDESHNVSRDIDESQHASHEIDESHNASRDIDESHHASHDIDESKHASCDIDESSHHASHEIDESSHHASRDIDESQNVSREIDESSHHASNDIDESSHDASHDIDESHLVSYDISQSYLEHESMNLEMTSNRHRSHTAPVHNVTLKEMSLKSAQSSSNLLADDDVTWQSSLIIETDKSQIDGTSCRQPGKSENSSQLKSTDSSSLDQHASSDGLMMSSQNYMMMSSHNHMMMSSRNHMMMSSHNHMRFKSPSLRHLSQLMMSSLLDYFIDNLKGSENEEMRYVMWDDVVFHDDPDAEIQCGIFMSNKSIYFISDNRDDFKLKYFDLQSCNFIKNSSHLSYTKISFDDVDRLEQVVIGSFNQYVRLSCSTSTATIATRSSSSTQQFIYRLLMALDVDSNQSNEILRLLDQSHWLDDKEMICNGVSFIIANEQAMNEFNFMSAEILNRTTNAIPKLISYFLVHYVIDMRKQPMTFVLTSECCCLCKEDIVSYPLVHHTATPPTFQRYRDFNVASLTDVQYLALDDITSYDVTIVLFDRDENEQLLWRLEFCDYDEREKMINLICKQYELVRGESLGIRL